MLRTIRRDQEVEVADTILSAGEVLDIDAMSYVLRKIRDGQISAEESIDRRFFPTVEGIRPFYGRSSLAGLVTIPEVVYTSLVVPGKLLYGSTEVEGGVNAIRGFALFSVEPANDSPITLTPRLDRLSLIQGLKKLSEKGDSNILSLVGISQATGRQVLSVEDGEYINIVVDTLTRYEGIDDDVLTQIKTIGESEFLSIEEKGLGLVLRIPKRNLLASSAYRGTEKFPPIRYTGPLLLPGTAIQVGVVPSDDDTGRATVEDFFYYMRGMCEQIGRIVGGLYSGELEYPERAVKDFRRRLVRKATHRLRGAVTPLVGLEQVLDVNPQAYKSEDLKRIRGTSHRVIIESADAVEGYVEMDLALRPFPFGGELVEALDTATEMYSRAIRVVVGFDRDQMKALEGYGIPHLIPTIIDNFVSNATKGRAKNIKFEVSFEGTESRPYVRVVASDDGEGFSKDTLDQFHNEERVINSKSKGTGRGLKTDRALIEYIASGINDSFTVGNIITENERGEERIEGGRVSFCIPIKSSD